MTLTLDGSYKAKVRFLGITFWSKTSKLWMVQNVDPGFESAYQPFGPASLHIEREGTLFKVSARLPFLGDQLLLRADAKTRKPQPFKVELDKANQVEGTVTIS